MMSVDFIRTQTNHSTAEDTGAGGVTPALPERGANGAADVDELSI
jgi:hypothetical protein